MDTDDQSRLFLDCSGPGVKLGILRKGVWVDYRHTPGSALETLFEEVEVLLEGQRLTLPDVRGIWFCAGPGSLLSLRVGAMAVQTWHLTTAFREPPQIFPLMESAGYLLSVKHPDFLLVAPGRKGEWHQIIFRDGQPVDNAARVNTADMDWDPRFPAYWIPHRELGHDLPGEFFRWEPDWSTTPGLWNRHPLLSSANPQSLLPDQHASTYARWSGAIHQK